MTDMALALLTRIGRKFAPQFLFLALLTGPLSGTLSNAAQAAAGDVRAGLTAVGFAALPEFLDATTDNITLKFPAALGGGKLSFGGSIDADALKQKKFVFTTSEAHKLNWSKAFGQSWLSLSDVSLSLSIEKGAFDIKLQGNLGGALAGGKKSLAVVIELSVADKKLHDFVLSLPNTKLALKDIPDLKSLPGASSLSISAPTLSLNAIGGKINFKGDALDAVIFHDPISKGWNVALKLEKPLTFGSLIGHKKGFLNKIALPEMTVLLSTKGLKRGYDDLPLALQNFYTTGGETLPEGDLELEKGANLQALFDPDKMPADVKKALGKLGLSGKLEVDGQIGGLFGGTPSIAIEVAIDMPKSHSFGFLKARPKVDVKFFIKLSESTESIGFETEIELKSGKQPLYFDVQFALLEQTGTIEVQVSGGMKGDWKNAIGIKGLTLEDPFLSVGINESGSLDVMIDGSVMVGHVKIRATADMVLSPEAAGLPTAIALAGSINKLDFNALTAHAKKHAKMKGGGFKHLDVAFKDLSFAFMTPGVHLPADLVDKLHIEGAGMALTGSLLVNGKEIGSVGGYVSTEGILINGKLDPFHLGPINLKEADLTIQAGPSVDPLFRTDGDIVLFKGFEEKYKLDLEPSHFEFSSDTKFGGLFEAILKVETHGTSLAKGGDLDFDAELKADFYKQFRNLVQDALKGMKKADDKMKGAQATLKKDKAKVAKLKTKIAAAKKQAKASFDAASKKIDGAKHKVDGLQDHINYLNRKIHDLKHDIHEDKKHLRVGKAIKHGAELTGREVDLKTTQAAKKTADWALTTASKGVHAVPVNAAPKVVALAAELKAAQAGLDIAIGAVGVARKADEGVEAATKAVLKAGSGFKLNKLGASGSLLGITTGGKHGKKPTLIIDISIKGKRHVYHENIGSLKSEFKHLAGEIAKQVAKDLVNIFKKK